MINVTVGEQKPQQVNEYPKIMKGALGSVVLFIAPKKGTLIVQDSNNSSIKFGEYYEGWIMDTFKDFNEPVTIQNA